MTLTMAVSPLLIRNSQQLTDAILGVTRPGGASDDKDRYQSGVYTGGHVIVGGYGRVGKVIMELLEENNIPCVAIDKDVKVVVEAQAQTRNVLSRIPVIGRMGSSAVLLFGYAEEARG